MGVKQFYRKFHKPLLIIPTVLLILAIFQISFQISSTGDFVKKGVSLKGGVEFELEENIDINELETYLNQEFPNADFSIRELITQEENSISITATEIEFSELISKIKEKYGEVNHTEPTITSASLGASFFRQTVKALIFAFLFIALVVFAYFRALVPSGFIVFTLFSDIIVTLSIVNLIGITISTAGIVAFLMLIGYSVDTDILLTSRLLKRKNEELYSRLVSAMKTGVMMVVTTLSAVIIALFLSSSPFIQEVMTIILIGLIVDLIFTWFQNAPILIYYLERKK